MKLDASALAEMERMDRRAFLAIRRTPLACRVELHWPARGVRDPKVQAPRKMVFCRRCGTLMEYSIMKAK